MSSPFSLFRKHQRILMVITTGLAMISFVLLGAVNDPREMPPALIIAALAAMVGGAGWILGLNTGKASEWGVTGLAAGAVLGLAMNMLNRTPDAVLMSTGNMTREDLALVRQQRSLANYFVQRAASVTGMTNPYQMIQYQFGINKNDDSVREAVLNELLRREADSLGITISDDAIFEFINEITQNKLSKEQFKEIRKQTGSTEYQILAALRNEMKAKEAMRILYPEQYSRAYPEPLSLFIPPPAALPPAELWDFHKKLNVRQSAEIIEVPVSNFVDKSAKPSDAERAELFARYRENYPLFTAAGQFEEGRPGFRQPPRMRLAYLEAVSEEIEKLVPPVTDEEVQARYEQVYLKSVPGEEDMESLESPLLPQTPVTPPAGTESTAPAGTPEETPASEPAPEKPAAPAGTEPAAETPPSEESKPDTTPEKAPEEKPSEESSSAILRQRLIPVAFLGDDPAPAEGAPAETPQESPAETANDSPATEAPKDAPAAEGSAEAAPLAAPAETPEQPAKDDVPPPVPTADKPAETPATETAPSEVIPPPPSGPRPLDDDLKAQIRQELLRIRAQEEISKRIQAANAYMQDLAYRTVLGPEEQNYVKKEELGSLLKKYAGENHLEYVETDWLSYEEMRNSEDYPLGKAYDTTARPIAVVPDRIFGSNQSLYIPSTAVNFETSSSFSYWVIEQKDEAVPEGLDDPKLVEQVDEAWRLQQALPKARARAEELAKLLSTTKSPATELLAEKTVTGKEGGIFLTVTETGDFTWMTKPAVPPTSMAPNSTVTRTTVPGAPKAGNRFMTEIFENLKPGEAGIAPAYDDSVLYVIRIQSRYPSNDQELEQLRKSFIAAGSPATYSALADSTIGQYSENWVDQLWKKHDVQLSAALEEQSR